MNLPVNETGRERRKRNININALNEMLKRVQHDNKKCVIPNLFRNLDSGNVNKLIAFVLDRRLGEKEITILNRKED